MIRKLRKRHLWIWMVIPLIAVPIIVVAILMRPEFPEIERIINTPTAAEGVIQKQVENDALLINMRGTTHSISQLELILKQPIRSPFCLVYLSQQGSMKKLLGDIGQRGVYRFSIDTSSQYDGIILYDHIQKKQLTQVEF